MDVIKTQASSQIAVNYIATGVAFLAMLLVYPLELPAYGLAHFISMTAMFLVPFVTLGTYASVVKFFQEFRNNGHSASYLTYLLVVATGVMVGVFGLAYLLRKIAYRSLDMLGFDVLLIQQNIWQLVLITVFVVYGRILTMHASNYNKTAVPALYNQLLPKIVLPILVYLVYAKVIDLDGMTWLWAASFGLTVLGLLMYLKAIDGLDLKWDWSGFSLPFLRRLSVYSSYTGLSLVGSVLANKLDVIMVTLLLGKEQNAIYVFAMFIASVMQIPTGAVWQITSPQIAKAWEANDLGHISKLYKRSSSNLFVSGLVVYFIFLGTIDSVFQLTANYTALQAAVVVFAILGVARLFDMLTSINTQILMYSDSYKMNTVFVVILGVLNVGLNYLLIREYGLMGAAVATLISVVIYNVLKSGYILLRYRLSLWSNDMYRIILFGIVLGACYYFFPTIKHPILQIVVYSASMGIVSLGLIWILRINTDFIPFFLSKSAVIREKLGIGRRK